MGSASKPDGDDDDIAAELPVLRSLREQDKRRNAFVGVVAGLVGWQVARLVPGSGILLVVLGVPFAIGALTGRYLFRSRPTLRAVAAWSGLVTWILPVLGMFTGGAALLGQAPERPLTGERILAGLTIVLSAVNSAVGAFMR